MKNHRSQFPRIQAFEIVLVSISGISSRTHDLGSGLLHPRVGAAGGRHLGFARVGFIFGLSMAKLQA